MILITIQMQKGTTPATDESVGSNFNITISDQYIGYTHLQQNLFSTRSVAKSHDSSTDINIKVEPSIIKFETETYEQDEHTAETDCALSHSEGSIGIDIKDEPLRIKEEAIEPEVVDHCGVTPTTDQDATDVDFILQYNSSRDKDYVCDICLKRFNRKHHLTEHMRTHTGEKPYECHICQKRFAKLHKLARHKRTHTGEKPYECHICRKRFTENYTLTTHMRTHTGEKPYGCDICQKRFNRKSQLTVHTRTHTGEKPYECDICQKRFADRSTFATHKRTHTGEKPYECDLCYKLFSQKIYRRVHMRSHTDKSRKIERKPHETL